MVEIKSIGSLIKRKRLKANKTTDIIPVYAVTNNSGFVLSASLHEFTIHSEDTSNYSVVEKNDFAYNPSRLNIGSISCFNKEGKGLVSPMYVVFHADEGKVLPEYLYIVIKSESVRNKINSLKEEGARFRFDFTRWNLIDIPVPSLSEQQRIVDILYTFTSSINNLKQQIEQRRKQYEYYREKLMNVDEGPEARLTSLGEIGTFERGNGIQKKDFTEEGVGCIHYGQIHTSYGLSTTKTISYISEEQAKKCKKAQCGDIIIATTSEDVEGCAKAVAWMGNHEICISGDSLVFHHNENSKYIAYLFQMNYFQKFKRGRCTGAKVTRISPKALSDYPFVLPIRSMQAEIVSKLDNFENIIRNLEEQLKLREKQYEYYRNKLLTFK